MKIEYNFLYLSFFVCLFFNDDGMGNADINVKKKMDIRGFRRTATLLSDLHGYRSIRKKKLATHAV